jgi:hypothetical protein
MKNGNSGWPETGPGNGEGWRCCPEWRGDSLARGMWEEVLLGIFIRLWGKIYYYLFDYPFERFNVAFSSFFWKEIFVDTFFL